jgi:hypothetical protein
MTPKTIEIKRKERATAIVKKAPSNILAPYPWRLNIEHRVFLDTGLGFKKKMGEPETPPPSRK